jgi:alpha-N-arabinofuranosidase
VHKYIFIALAAWSAAVPVLLAQEAPTSSATVVVRTRSIVRQIPPTLFGTNTEWVWNGYGLWDERADRADPSLSRFAQQLGVTLIRYPGGMYADFYHWRQGVGPAAQRPVVPFRLGAPETGTIQFGTDEALRFAEEAGAELMITVNVGTGTPEEAAAWVRYVNRHRLRVRHWELGNELYINDGTVSQGSIQMPPQEYALKVLQFARAMRQADPRIRIGAIGGHNQGAYGLVAYPDWNKIVLQTAGAVIDFLAVHNSYAPVNVSNQDGLRDVYAAMLAAPVLIKENLEEVSRQINAFAGPGASRITIAVTEWGPFFQAFHAGRYVQHNRTLGSALFGASALKAFIDSPRTDIANFHVFHDMSIMCWICSSDGSFPPKPNWTETAPSMAFQLMRRHTGAQLVETTVHSPAFDSPSIGLIGPVQKVPYLEVLPTMSSDGKSLFLLVNNKHFDLPLTASITLEDFEPAALAEVSTLNGTGIDAHTGTVPLQVPGVEWAAQAEDPANPRFRLGGPGEITVTESRTPAGRQFTYTFPAHSLTALRLQRLNP